MVDVPPVVFISYTHDTGEHADHVLDFANALAEDGVRVILDRYVPSPKEGWHRWMERGIDEADYVLLVCTEPYLRRITGKARPGEGLGVRWEGTIIYSRIYETPDLGDRFIPILFAEEDHKNIPLPLKSHQRYVITNPTLEESSYEYLYRHLTGQPAVEVPTFDKPLKRLPPRRGLKRTEALHVNAVASSSEEESKTTRRTRGKGGASDYFDRKLKEYGQAADEFLQRDMVDLAIANATEGLKSFPKDPNLLITRLQAYAKAERWTELLSDARSYKHLFSHAAHGYVFEAWAQFRIGELSRGQAAQEMLNALGRYQGTAYIFFFAAISLLELQGTTIAREPKKDEISRLADDIIELGLSRTPKYLGLLIVKGLRLHETGNTDSGLEMLRSLRHALPTSGTRGNKISRFYAIQNIGIAYGMLGRYLDALDCFDAAKLIDRKSGRPYFLAACCYAKIGETDLALEKLESAIKFNPNYQVYAKVVRDFDNLRELQAFQDLVYS